MRHTTSALNRHNVGRSMESVHVLCVHLLHLLHLLQLLIQMNHVVRSLLQFFCNGCIVNHDSDAISIRSIVSIVPTIIVVA